MKFNYKLVESVCVCMNRTWPYVTIYSAKGHTAWLIGSSHFIYASFINADWSFFLKKLVSTCNPIQTFLFIYIWAHVRNEQNHSMNKMSRKKMLSILHDLNFVIYFNFRAVGTITVYSLLCTFSVDFLLSEFQCQFQLVSESHWILIKLMVWNSIKKQVYFW